MLCIKIFFKCFEVAWAQSRIWVHDSGLESSGCHFEALTGSFTHIVTPVQSITWDSGSFAQ